MNRLNRPNWPRTLSLCCLMLLGSPNNSLASDYAREKRFADEISPTLVVGDAVQIAHAGFPSFLGLFAQGSKTKPAIVLAHGVGMHPDEGLTGELRKRLNDLGYTTLAIQMPVAAKEAQIDAYFPKLFPEASARLGAAAKWLQGRGHGKIALVSHTMGSWMANVHFDERAGDPANLYGAWVCISLTGGYSLATHGYTFPILDLYGDNDIGVTVSSAWRRGAMMRLAASGSKQTKIIGADAQWRAREGAAATAIDDFIGRVLR